MIELDYALAVQIILNAKVDNHSRGSLVSNCHALMHQSWFCEIRHICRKNNFVGDDLACLGLLCSLDPVFFSNLFLLVICCKN